MWVRSFGRGGWVMSLCSSCIQFVENRALNWVWEGSLNSLGLHFNSTKDLSNCKIGLTCHQREHYITWKLGKTAQGWKADIKTAFHSVCETPQGSGDVWLCFQRAEMEGNGGSKWDSDFLLIKGVPWRAIQQDEAWIWLYCSWLWN